MLLLTFRAGYLDLISRPILVVGSVLMQIELAIGQCRLGVHGTYGLNYPRHHLGTMLVSSLGWKLFLPEEFFFLTILIFELVSIFLFSFPRKSMIFLLKKMKEEEWKLTFFLPSSLLLFFLFSFHKFIAHCHLFQLNYPLKECFKRGIPSVRSRNSTLLSKSWPGRNHLREKPKTKYNLSRNQAICDRWCMGMATLSSTNASTVCVMPVMKVLWGESVL